MTSTDVNHSQQPDTVVRYIHQHNYVQDHGYGDIKTQERAVEHYELVRDLVRCCIFCKESRGFQSAVEKPYLHRLIKYRRHIMSNFNVEPIQANGTSQLRDTEGYPFTKQLTSDNWAQKHFFISKEAISGSFSGPLPIPPLVALV